MASQHLLPSSSLNTHLNHLSPHFRPKEHSAIQTQPVGLGSYQDEMKGWRGGGMRRQVSCNTTAGVAVITWVERHVWIGSEHRESQFWPG